VHVASARERIRPSLEPSQVEFLATYAEKHGAR
jgi:hypothetical protein